MGAKKKPKGWRAVKHTGGYAVIDECDDLIADCYSNQEDALTMAASHETREALLYLGGGSEYIKQCGRLCFCPNNGRNSESTHHSSSCNYAWGAYQKAMGGSR